MFYLRANIVEWGSTLSQGIFKDERLCSRLILIIFFNYNRSKRFQIQKNVVSVLVRIQSQISQNKKIPNYLQWLQLRILPIKTEIILIPNLPIFPFSDQNLNFRQRLLSINYEMQYSEYFDLILYKLIMNLTLIFIVLSIAIGYMLYDTFKKSRQTLPNDTQSVSRIKTNYQTQCKILKSLHQQKLNALKNRSLSIHLDQLKFLGQQKVSAQEKKCIVQVIIKISKTTKVYVLVKKTIQQTWLQKIMKSALPSINFIPYSSLQGAVAILRQLSCPVHIESDEKLFKIVKQYLPNIWMTGNDQYGQAKCHYQNELEMILSLQKLMLAYQEKQKQRLNNKKIVIENNPHFGE